MLSPKKVTSVWPELKKYTERQVINQLFGFFFLQQALFPRAPAKRSQHFNATYGNSVGTNMLCAFVHLVATLCHVLGVASRTGAHGATLLHEPGQMSTTSCNIPRMLREKSGHFQT